MEQDIAPRRGYLSTKYPLYGFIFWSAIIMIMGRHDYGFYAVSFIMAYGASGLLYVRSQKNSRSKRELSS